MGRIISDKNIAEMDRKDRRKVLRAKAKHDKPVEFLTKNKKPTPNKPDVLPLLVKAIDQSVQNSTKASLVIAEALNRIGKPVDMGKDSKAFNTDTEVENLIKQQWSKIEFTVTSRDYNGNLESFVAEKIN
ncbi:MAG: hypothetical protein JJV99_07780 [Colwellia sp.]|nr:hypothetical protein [Colwellia sp.]